MITISVGGKHTHFEVKVEAKKVPVESITLPAELADGVTLKIGETLDIAGKAIITPENATERTESYSSSVPMIASVSEEGVVTAIAIGETTITITIGRQIRPFHPHGREDSRGIGHAARGTDQGRHAEKR